MAALSNIRLWPNSNEISCPNRAVRSIQVIEIEQSYCNILDLPDWSGEFIMVDILQTTIRHIIVGTSGFLHYTV